MSLLPALLVHCCNLQIALLGAVLEIKLFWLLRRGICAQGVLICIAIWKRGGGWPPWVLGFGTLRDTRPFQRVVTRLRHVCTTKLSYLTDPRSQLVSILIRSSRNHQTITIHQTPEHQDLSAALEEGHSVSDAVNS